MCGRPRSAKIVHLDAYSTLRPTPVRNLIDISARQVTTGVVDSPPTMLVLDLTGIRFLAASGIRVLLETRERAALTETSLGLVHSTRAVNRVLDVLQLTICSRLTQHLPMPLPTNANLRSSVPPQAGVPDTGAGRVARRPTVKSGSEVTQEIAKPPAGLVTQIMKIVTINRQQHSALAQFSYLVRIGEQMAPR